MTTFPRGAVGRLWAGLKVKLWEQHGSVPHGTWGGTAGPGSEPGPHQGTMGQLSTELECVSLSAFPLGAYLYRGAIEISVYSSRYQQSFIWVYVC